MTNKRYYIQASGSIRAIEIENEIKERQRILAITRLSRNTMSPTLYRRERERQLRLCATVRAGLLLEPSD